MISLVAPGTLGLEIGDKAIERRDADGRVRTRRYAASKCFSEIDHDKVVPLPVLAWSRRGVHGVRDRRQIMIRSPRTPLHRCRRRKARRPRQEDALREVEGDDGRPH